MITLAVGCLVVLVIACVAMAILSVPIMLIMSILPWLIGVAGIVLLVKAVLDKPMRWENFMPAVVAFVLYGLLKWIF